MSDKVSKDRQDRIEAIDRHEKLLTNGKRGDVGTMSDAIVEHGRAVKLMLGIDFVRREDCRGVSPENCDDEKTKSGGFWNMSLGAAMACLGLIWSLLEFGTVIAEKLTTGATP